MTLEESLQAFPRWMNRPLQRVHVYTWRLACDLEPGILGELSGGIRYRPEYRSAACKGWRRAVANALRGIRKRKRILLPTWSEATGEYSKP